MQSTITPIVVGFLLLAFCGCQTRQADPSIAGEWSEPVNGIRMRLMHVMPPGGTRPDVTLLIFAQNISDEPVDLPRLRPEPFVKVLHGSQKQAGISDANLRITAQPMDGQDAAMQALEMMQQQQDVEIHNPLKPGELRVFALKVVDALQMQYLHQLSDDTIYAEHISWPGLDDEKSAGRWRLHAVYRPSGFNPPDSGHAWKVDQPWMGRQIDLPVTVLNLDPWHYHEDGQIDQSFKSR